MSGIPHPIKIDIESKQVSALLQVPSTARAVYVMAHGAGAGMSHPFLSQVADGFGREGIATLRYQFPYMEAGSKRPDPPKIAHATVRAAVGAASRLLPGLPLYAGGKSFGGRMTSQAQAHAPLADVIGLVFIGFPLHAAGKPSIDRAEHLSKIHVPMLFLQGTNDKLAELSLLVPVVAALRGRAQLVTFDDADHSFHVPVRSGRKDADVMSALVSASAAWISGR